MIPASWLRSMPSHLLMMGSQLLMMRGQLLVLRCHLLMMLRVHLLVMMLLLLIYSIRSVSSASMFSHFVGVRVVSLNVLAVAMKIFSFVLVPVIVGRVLVAVFFTVHSCSLAMIFSGHVSNFVFSFSRSGCPCGSNALCAFAVLVGLIK